MSCRTKISRTCGLCDCTQGCRDNMSFIVLELISTKPSAKDGKNHAIVLMYKWILALLPACRSAAQQHQQQVKAAVVRNSYGGVRLLVSAQRHCSDSTGTLHSIGGEHGSITSCFNPKHPNTCCILLQCWCCLLGLALLLMGSGSRKRRKLEMFPRPLVL